jgi:hypothetical protein
MKIVEKGVTSANPTYWEPKASSSIPQAIFSANMGNQNKHKSMIDCDNLIGN